MKNFYICVIILILFVTPSLASSKTRNLTLNQEDIEELTKIKGMVKDVDHKPLAQWIKEVEKTQYPRLNIVIKEAMAKAYVDIVKEQAVVDIKKKEWLYSMVALNMAYLQFGGGDSNHAPDLDRLIRRKLKGYLPAGIVSEQGFHYSLD